MSSCTGCGSIIDINSIIMFMTYFFLIVAVTFIFMRNLNYKSKDQDKFNNVRK